jgi:hypothetical protein
MPDYVPVSVNGSNPYTLTASTAITGGFLVEMTAIDDNVTLSGGANHPVGVAAHDAVAAQRVTIFPLSGVVHETPVQNTVALVAGNPVIPAASAGRITSGILTTVAQAGLLIGICTRGATGTTTGVTTGVVTTPAKARWIGIA